MKRSAGWLARIGVLTVSLALTALALEVGFRIGKRSFGVDVEAIGHMRALVLRGESAHYAPRAFTNFALRPGDWPLNELGFYGWPADHPREKLPGVVRIACLGASTTQGGHQGANTGTYPFQLERILQEEAEQTVEVMNWGVSSWTTAETMVNYFLTVTEYEPDILVIHHAINDVFPRLYANYRSDYTHFRKSWSPPSYPLWQRALVSASDLATWTLLRTKGRPDLRQILHYDREGPLRLEADGSLDPDTARGFRSHLEMIAEHAVQTGGRVAFLSMPVSSVREHGNDIQRMGIRDHNRIVRDELARGAGRLLVDADRDFGPRSEDPEASLFRDIVHAKDARGNGRKARLVADALFDAGWLTRR